MSAPGFQTICFKLVGVACVPLYEVNFIDMANMPFLLPFRNEHPERGHFHFLFPGAAPCACIWAKGPNQDVGGDGVLIVGAAVIVIWVYGTISIEGQEAWARVETQILRRGPSASIKVTVTAASAMVMPSSCICYYMVESYKILLTVNMRKHPVAVLVKGSQGHLNLFLS